MIALRTIPMSLRRSSAHTFSSSSPSVSSVAPSGDTVRLLLSSGTALLEDPSLTSDISTLHRHSAVLAAVRDVSRAIRLLTAPPPPPPPPPSPTLEEARHVLFSLSTLHAELGGTPLHRSLYADVCSALSEGEGGAEEDALAAERLLKVLASARRGGVEIFPGSMVEREEPNADAKEEAQPTDGYYEFVGEAMLQLARAGRYGAVVRLMDGLEEEYGKCDDGDNIDKARPARNVPYDLAAALLREVHGRAAEDAAVHDVTALRPSYGEEGGDDGPAQFPTLAEMMVRDEDYADAVDLILTLRDAMKVGLQARMDAVEMQERNLMEVMENMGIGYSTDDMDDNEDEDLSLEDSQNLDVEVTLEKIEEKGEENGNDYDHEEDHDEDPNLRKPK